MGLGKLSFRKSIGKICLNIVQLETILTEVQAVVSSRPLVNVGADLNSGYALTPGDYLCLNRKPGVPSLAPYDEHQVSDFVGRLGSSQRLMEA